MLMIVKLKSLSLNSKFSVSVALILKGQWLKEAGFNFGEYVEVICEGEKIILSKTLDPEENTVKSLEEKMKSLDKKQKAKLVKIIDKL